MTYKKYFQYINNLQFKQPLVGCFFMQKIKKFNFLIYI